MGLYTAIYWTISLHTHALETIPFFAEEIYYFFVLLSLEILNYYIPRCMWLLCCVEGAKWWQFCMMERQQVHCGRGYPLSCFVTHLVGQSVFVVSSLLCFDFIDDENDFFTVYRFSLFIFAYFINLCFVGCFFWF